MELSTPATDLSALPQEVNTPAKAPASDELEIPQELTEEIKSLGRRVNNPRKIKQLVKKICSHKPRTPVQIARYFDKEKRYFKRQYLSTMTKDGEPEDSMYRQRDLAGQSRLGAGFFIRFCF